MTGGPTTIPTRRCLSQWARTVAGRVQHLPTGARIGLFMLFLIAILIGATPLWPGFDPYGQNLVRADLPPFSWVGDRFYPLGSDPLGRDYLSRIAVGTAVSALVGAVAVGISLALGVVLGMCAGFFRGRIETFVMGLADLQLAIPRILFLIAVTAAIGPSVVNLIVILGLTSWVGYGRVARAITMSLREREFVLAARTHGATSGWNIRKHVLPNVMPQMVIIATYELGQIIILEASLSYLGVGIQPPTPSLGMMVAEGQNYLRITPWLALLPGIGLFLLVAGAQFFSQGFTTEGRDDGFGGR